MFTIVTCSRCRSFDGKDANGQRRARQSCIRGKTHDGGESILGIVACREKPVGCDGGNVVSELGEAVVGAAVNRRIGAAGRSHAHILLPAASLIAAVEMNKTRGASSLHDEKEHTTLMLMLLLLLLLKHKWNKDDCDNRRRDARDIDSFAAQDRCRIRIPFHGAEMCAVVLNRQI